MVQLVSEAMHVDAGAIMRSESRARRQRILRMKKERRRPAMKLLLQSLKCLLLQFPNNNDCFSAQLGPLT